MANRKYSVDDKNGLSVKWTDTKKEAEEVAKWMMQYHKEQFTVRELQKRNGVLI